MRTDSINAIMRHRNALAKFTVGALLMFLCINVSTKTASAGNIDCPQCDLPNADYSGQTLVTPNFAGANLRNADFSNTTLQGANFIGADLRGANFGNAVIDSVRNLNAVPSMFQDADLEQASFTGAKLNDADFQYADITCADFSDVDTSKARFGPYLKMRAREDCKTRFVNATLSCEFSARWPELELTGAKLPDCGSSYTVEKGEHSEAPDGVQSMRMSGTSKLAHEDYSLRTRADSPGQTVYVDPGGVDRQGCGGTVEDSCKTIAFGMAQCSTTETCLVALSYGEYTPSQSIAPTKGNIVIDGGYLKGKPVSGYQSKVTAPSGGAPVFALTANAGGISLENLLLIGSSATPETGSAASQVILARNTQFNLTSVNVVSAAGVTGSRGGDGTAGADGNKGGHGSGSGSPGAGGTSGCNAAGGSGGKTDSITISTHLPFPWVVCKYSCEVRWYNAYDGQPGGTGHYAPGSSLARDDSLACYACPYGRGNMPKSAGTGSAGNKGSCGAGGRQSADTSGVLDSSGVWSPTNAGMGSAGNAGGGGGGGGPGGSCGYANCICSGSTYAGGAGGGGGAGGCGAAPGAGGQMGGASFGVVLAGSTVTFAGSGNVITGAGSGDGGAGGSGKSGGNGGEGGKGQNYDNYCNDGGASGAAGGAGGLGGASGAGAGGNAGPSINIALTSSGSAIIGQPVYYTGRSGNNGTKGTAGTTAGNCTASEAADGTGGLVTDTHTY